MIFSIASVLKNVCVRRNEMAIERFGREWYTMVYCKKNPSPVFKWFLIDSMCSTTALASAAFGTFYYIVFT